VGRRGLATEVACALKVDRGNGCPAHGHNIARTFLTDCDDRRAVAQMKAWFDARKAAQANGGH